jgi:hypothetical protein
MSIWDKIKKTVSREQPKKKSKTLSPKEQATKNGEPWVEVLSMEINQENPSEGAFELDWNDKFVANLVRAGYQGKTDSDIVDNWFRSVCRNIMMENFEQEQADPEVRSGINRRDLGDGRTEIS